MVIIDFFLHHNKYPVAITYLSLKRIMGYYFVFVILNSMNNNKTLFLKHIRHKHFLKQ